MGLSIKNDETERLVRLLAKRRGLGVTGAIRLAVANELAKDAPPPAPDWDEKMRVIREIQARWAKLPPIDMKEMDDWLYDEDGLPH